MMNRNTVLATVNGKEITEQDVYAFLSELDPQIAAQFNSPDGIKRLVNELQDGLDGKFRQLVVISQFL
jgi:peptidyl-prolyl cis-trans isomerase C